MSARFHMFTVTKLSRLTGSENAPWSEAAVADEGGMV